jgi:hypothetical protein
MISIFVNCTRFTVGLVVFLLWSTSAAVGADTPRATGVAPQIRVVGGGAEKANPIRMGGEVIIKVADLDKWLKQEEIEKDLSNLVVNLNDKPIKNTSIKARADDQLAFSLQQTSDSKATWSQLLGRPTESARRFKVSIGPATGRQLPGQDLYIQVISPGWFFFYCVLLVVLLILFGWMASRSNLIRDSTTLPTSADGYKPYSLAKLQMAVWFFLILSAFLFIWIVTGQYDSITPQVLGLMGIATGTALGAAVIDDNKNRAAASELTEMRPRCASLEQEIPMLTNKVAELQTTVTAATPSNPKDLDALKEAKVELEAKKSLWHELDMKMKDAKSRMCELHSTSFFDDILSDANGYSFHRFQIFAWTIVLGTLFVSAVWAELAMPQFSETLLALMGVSAGTYLGFKIAECPSDPSVGPR